LIIKMDYFLQPQQFSGLTNHSYSYSLLARRHLVVIFYN